MKYAPVSSEGLHLVEDGEERSVWVVGVLVERLRHAAEHPARCVVLEHDLPHIHRLAVRGCEESGLLGTCRQVASDGVHCQGPAKYCLSVVEIRTWLILRVWLWCGVCQDNVCHADVVGGVDAEHLQQELLHPGGLLLCAVLLIPSGGVPGPQQPGAVLLRHRLQGSVQVDPLGADGHAGEGGAPHRLVGVLVTR